ncbi:MAG TPA: PRC-barrel domain-containing protein [Candidatus Didemnitutus sp.]|nr:PRC-barrel domain-containing protein [Candidatus Didemnitutus sp.]
MKSLRMVVFSAVALPLALFAQSGSSSSRSGSNMPGPNSNSSGNLSSSDASSSVQRADKESLKNELTAKNLIGKDVYDNAGKKIGEVKDIVLEGQAPNLASAFAEGGLNDSPTNSRNTSAGSNNDNSDSSGSATPNTGRSGSATHATTGTGVTTAESGSMGRTGASASNGDSRGNLSSGSTSSASSRRMGGSSSSVVGSGSEEPAVIVGSGGFAALSGGGNMLRVPISQIRYDSNQKHLTVPISEAEANRIKTASN